MLPIALDALGAYLREAGFEMATFFIFRPGYLELRATLSAGMPVRKASDTYCFED
ncbi:hypothetical protein [Ulvibacter litoralis]|uniref:hypothetical protein n=1 Tax=Ulvibacter litoralis TaxID=227084 RepID=UPI001586AE94|nr:hypothetical protein [Ulvibacter litoralis]